MRPIELLTSAEMGRADQLAIASGIPGTTLMDRAGRAVADAAQRLAPAGPVAVLCGPGNNGGDGFVAARLLRARGRAVRIWLLGPRSALKGDAAWAADQWTGPVLPIEDLALGDAALVIDALFGAGLARDLDGPARAAVEATNAWSVRLRRPVLAVDVPSGLDGTTGAVRGVAIRATATVSFFRLKPGHVLSLGPDLSGKLVLADIGIPDRVLETIAPRAWLNEPALWGAHVPVPGRHGHKYARGHALVVSGGAWHTGAARLAAAACLRAGAGLVTLASPREALGINAAHLTAVMLTPCDDAAELAGLLADARKNVVVLGPGLGISAATAALVRRALAPRPGQPAVVLDADALTAFAGRGQELAGLARGMGSRVVLTPHDGEFARLFNEDGSLLESSSQRVSANETTFHSKLDKVRRAAAAVGCTVLLKGADTVVAAPDGRASIAHDLPAWLATAGSGDVLSGLVGGLLAQGMAPFEAASAAVWLHGDAARRFGPGLVSEDLPAQIPAALAALIPRLS